MGYVKELEDRERTCQAEEQADAVRMKRLCEEFGLGLDEDIGGDGASVNKGTGTAVTSRNPTPRKKARRNQD